MDIRHTATTCPYCGCGCGLTLETAEGRIQRSVPTPDSPVNRGKLCVKGWNVHEFIQHPDRLKTPLLRTEQGWQSLDWESALDHAAGELARIRDQYGPDSIGVLTWEMLVGRLPYAAGDALSMALKHVQDPIPRLPAPLRAGKRAGR